MGAAESSASKMPQVSCPSEFSVPERKSPVSVKFVPVSESSDEGSDIDNQLDLLRSGDQSDVTLVCAGQHFLGHTHIISARSDVFRAMFYDLNKDRTLTLVDVTPNTFMIVLDYMYSGKVPRISLETALKVYEASNMYEMQSLNNACKRIIKKKIKETNAALVLVFASKQNANDLKDIAVTYLARRKTYLLSENWRRFCENHPRLANDVFVAFVRRAA